MKTKLLIFYITVCVLSAATILAIFSRPSTASGGFRIERMAYADSVINKAIANDDFPGAVLCVVKRAADGESMGDVVYLKAYGNRQWVKSRNVASGEITYDTLPMSEDVIFDLASVSKCVGTTLSFMRVVENGQVRLSDYVWRHIPDFAPWESKPEKRGEKVEREHITVRHLLTHTSGLPAYINVPTFYKIYEKWGDPAKMNLRDSLISYLAKDAPRLNEPGEKMRYSCLNFITLQAIIERLSGERLDHFAQREIFEPLRLKNTWYNHIDEPKPYDEHSIIAPTSLESNGEVLCGEVHDPTARIVNRGVSGNAGVFSNAEDLAVIASMLLNGGVIKLPGEGLFESDERLRLFSEQTVKTFFSVPSGYEEYGRTLGWVEGGFGDLYSRGNGNTVNHTGYTGTSFHIDAEAGVAIILLTNRVHPYDNGSIGRTRATVANVVYSALD